jgi:hypothetical protein
MKKGGTYPSPSPKNRKSHGSFHKLTAYGLGNQEELLVLPLHSE